MYSSKYPPDESRPIQPKHFLGGAETKACNLRRLLWAFPEKFWDGENSVSREDMVLALDAIIRICAFGKQATVEEANDCAYLVEEIFDQIEQQIDCLLAPRNGCV